MKTARKFPRAAVTFRVEIDGEGFTMNGTSDLAIGDGGHERFPGNGDVRQCAGRGEGADGVVDGWPHDRPFRAVGIEPGVRGDDGVPGRSFVLVRAG